jgi:serine/threonine protein kinase
MSTITPSGNPKSPAEPTDSVSAPLPATKLGPPSDAYAAPASSVSEAIGGYRIEKLLGAGGMGAVYLARDERLDRPVAVKTMKPEVAAQSGAVERFLREARAAAMVSHDNVIPILHIGEDAGTPYIVMPLLEGEPLNALLKRDPTPPLGVALKVGRETADGLAAAHAAGLIHRDIKPANIWVEGDARSGEWARRIRRVKVLDFGLARPAADDTHLTGEGAVLGTPAYMSPEQARAQPLDARTDVFSLGIVLYRMLTGVMPFAGGSYAAVLTSLAVDTPVPAAERNPDVPAEVSALVMRMLAKPAAERPTAAEVAAELRAIGQRLASGPLPRVVAYAVPSPDAADSNPFTELLSDDSQHAGPVAPPADAQRVPSAVVWATVGLLVLVAVALVAGVVWKLSQPPGGTPTTPTGSGPTKLGPTNPGPTNPGPPNPDPLKPPDYAAERDTAERILRVGGAVGVRLAQADPRSHPRDVTAMGDLPTEPFVVVIANLNGCRNIKPLLVLLKDLPAVGRLYIAGSELKRGDLKPLRDMKVLGLVELTGQPIEDDDLNDLPDRVREVILLHSPKVTDDGRRRLLKRLPDVRFFPAFNP